MVPDGLSVWHHVASPWPELVRFYMAVGMSRMNHTAKGKSHEREVRRAFLDAGFPARRTPRSGATDFAKGDIQFLDYRGLPRPLESDGPFWTYPHVHTIECKRRSLPTWLKDCLDQDVAVIREDRGENIAVLKLSTLLELMK